MAEPELIRDILRESFQRFSSRIALVSPGGSRSFAELEERSLRLANVLWQLGVRSSDSVGYVVSSDTDILIDVRLATYELGATLFGIPAQMLPDGAELVRAVEPKVVIYDPDEIPGVPEWLVATCPWAEALPARSAEGPYGGLFAKAPAKPLDNHIDPNGLCAVGFTSGTTGHPKGITATHHAAAWSCRKMQLTPAGMDESGGGMLIGIPLFAAGSGMLVPTLAAGGTVYALDGFDAAKAVDLIDSGEVVSAFLTPSMVIDMLDVPDLDQRDFSRVRAIVYGTSIMPVPKLEEAVRRMGPVFLQGYGMAEVLPPVTLLTPAEHGTIEQPATPTVLSSCGRVVPEVRVRVTGSSGNELPQNKIGEVEVASPAVTTGYWGDAARTRASVHDGWWRSGDVGFTDDDGRLHILSRQADVMWCDGRAVFPRVVEEACSRHPVVKEACAVQACPNDSIVAAVSLRSAYRPHPDLHRVVAEIQDLVSKLLNGSASVDDIMVFDEIPRSVQGKVLHRQVRSAVAAEGGIGVA